jgi:hypothetical protein
MNEFIDDDYQGDRET